MIKKSCARDLSLDSLKFLLVCLVIMGHILEKGTEFDLNRGLFNWIYLFHMPLFIIISGRFTTVSDGSKALKGILTLIETYLVAEILYIAYNAVFLGSGIGLRSLLSIKTPYFHLWYLLSLAIWRCILLGINKITPPIVIKRLAL